MLQKDVTFEKVVVTPEGAKEWLETCNKGNRNVSRQEVRGLVAQMQEGRWRENPACPIVFAESGRLLDGQHRLAAVIGCGLPMPMWVVRNVPEDDFLIMDTHRKRTLGDMFRMAAVPSCTHLSAVVKKKLALDHAYLRKCRIEYVAREVGALGAEVALDEFRKKRELYFEGVAFSNTIRNEYSPLFPVVDVASMYVHLVDTKCHTSGTVRVFFTRFARDRHGMFATGRLTLEGMKRKICRGGNHNSREWADRWILYVKLWNRYITGKEASAVKIGGTPSTFLESFK